MTLETKRERRASGLGPRVEGGCELELTLELTSFRPHPPSPIQPYTPLPAFAYGSSYQHAPSLSLIDAPLLAGSCAGCVNGFSCLAASPRSSSRPFLASLPLACAPALCLFLS